MSPSSEREDLPDGFESTVFINCPFDTAYDKLMRPLLFTVVYAGYAPVLASQTSDSAESRIEKICSLITSAQLSIHDLSRKISEEKGEFFRMNMPFELGVDYGTRQHGAEYLRTKKFLLLEAEKHKYKIALSDLSGVDIKYHRNEPAEVVRAVRDWFYETLNERSLDFPKVIWNKFNDDFNTTLFEERLARGLPEHDVAEDIERMSVSEFIDCCRDWMARR